MITVRNMTSPKTYREICNQFIIEGDGHSVFQSYASMIADIDWKSKTISIGEDWNYSRTTGKYRNLFFDEMGMGGLSTTDGLRKAMRNGTYGDYKIVECQTIKKSSQMLGLGTERPSPYFVGC